MRAWGRGPLAATLIALFASGASAAPSPSFECSRATGTVEKLVCDHTDLAELDRRLDGYYEGAEHHFAESGECLRKDQQEWLRSVRDRCADAGCLRNAYLNRLATLDAAQPGAASIKDMKLPIQPSLAAIVPPNGDAGSMPAEASTPVELTGRYALDDDYGLTLTDDQSRLYVLASLLNQEVPLELAALEQEDAGIRVRGRLLKRKPSSEDYPDLTAPHGVFDPHECIYVYRVTAGARLVND